MWRALVLVAVIAGLAFGAANYERHPLAAGARADRIVVEKSARKLTLFRGETPLKSYPVALGRAPTGAKERDGDHRTPEGHYVIDAHKRNSAFHRALHISYPSPTDSAAAAQRDDRPGGDIMIHGYETDSAGLELFTAASTGPLVASPSQTNRLRRFTGQFLMARLSTFNHDTF